MYRVYLFSIFFFVLMILSFNGIGQRIQGAVIGGFNLAQVDGDEIYGFNKLGVNTGLAAIVPFGKRFNVSLEILFNQKGSFQGKQYEEQDTAGNIFNGKYNLTLNYLEVPLLFLYNDKDVLTGGVGVSYGRLVSLKEYEHDKKVETTTLNGGPYERNDFNFLADIRFRIYKRLKLNLRYAYSLAKIRTRDFYDTRGEYLNTRKQYNNLISIRMIYMFNEKPPVANTKNINSDF